LEKIIMVIENFDNLERMRKIGGGNFPIPLKTQIHYHKKVTERNED